MQGKKREAPVTESKEEAARPTMSNSELVETVTEEVDVDSPRENLASDRDTAVVERLEGDLRKERETSSEYLRRLQYMQADFENYRKRVDREMSDVKRYGNDRLLAEFLVVVDEFELGLEKAREQAESPALVQGMGMVLKRFQSLLAKEGIARIEGVGSKFNPTVHEAALRVPSEMEEGVVVEEIRPGYTLKGRVIRPSIVKVSQGKESGQDNVQNNTEHTVEEEENREQ